LISMLATLTSLSTTVSNLSEIQQSLTYIGGMTWRNELRSQ
jgi:hypothetical protein